MLSTMSHKAFRAFLLVVGIAGIILGLLIGTVEKASAAPLKGNCWSTGYYNYSAYVGEGTDIEIELGPNAAKPNKFNTYRCNNGEVRYDVTKANTPAEYRALRAEVKDPLGHTSTWLFCVTEKGRKAYMVNWVWHTKEIQVRAGEKAVYNQWAADHKRKNGCLASGDNIQLNN